MDNKTFNFSVGLGEGRIPASQMKDMKFHYTPIPFDLNEVEDFTKEIGQVLQHEYGLNNVDMSIKYGFFEDWGKKAKNSGGSANKTAGKYISTEKRLDIYMDSLWGKTLNRYGATPTIDQFKEMISDTVAHELRHQWQFENKEGIASDLWKKQDEYVDSLANKYSSINQLTHKDYLNHPIEIDARNYGLKFRTTYKEKINDYRNMMNSTATKPNTNIEADSYTPTIGDNFIDNDTGERYVLNEIDKANPDLGINNDTYYYSSPNGERITRQKPITANDRYSLSTEDVLSPDDVRRIDNSFNDLRTYTDSLEEAKLRLSSLQNDFNNGADNLDEIYHTTKSVRSLEEKVSQARIQIDYDNNTFNSNGRYSYDINEKTRSYMDKADELLGPDYSETKYVINYDEVFKKNMPNEAVDDIVKTPETAKNNYNRNRRDGRNVRQQNQQRKKTKNKGRSGNKPGKNGPTKSIDQLNKEARQLKFANDAYEQQQKQAMLDRFNETKKLYEDTLSDWKTASGDFNARINNRNLKLPDELINNGSVSHSVYAETQNYLNKRNIDYEVDGSYYMNEEVFKYTKGKGVDGKDVLKIDGDVIDAPNAYASDLNKMIEDAKATMSPEDYAKFKNGFEPEKALVKTDTGRVKVNNKKILKNMDLPNFGTVDKIMSGINIISAVGDYKDSRRKGHGVVSSAARAGAQFALGEVLGPWYIGAMVAKEVPGLIVKGADTLYKENRRMNSAANFQTFGDAQFMDTQQLATMRQSGMEMAKMSQYNLQQTLMGNEATYLHR